MSDIQRYGFYEPFGASISTQPEFGKKDNGEYVKYDDYIAEVEFANKMASEANKRHTEICLEKKALQARIDELIKEQLDSSKQVPDSVRRYWKAEGIEEFAKSLPDNTSFDVFVKAGEYADKLEKDNERNS